MTSTSASARARLRLVHPRAARLRSVPHETEVAEFYDRTITAVWRLAQSLYPADVRQASDAVVEAYRTVWFGPAARTQAALLHALVIGLRPGHEPVPA